MKSTPPRRPNTTDAAPKPYELIPFPKDRPSLASPAGHDRYLHTHLHGALHLTLHVQTTLHVSTGVVGMGSDVGKNHVPLIKTMTQTVNNQLVIQGSSFKGCVRAIYEAITNSTLAVITQSKRDRRGQKRFYGNKYPKERKPIELKVKDTDPAHARKLCPAGRVFGALNYQGLLQFSDAQYAGEVKPANVGFMPSLYSPELERKQYYEQTGLVTGRKFYYNMKKSIDRGENRGIPVQQAAKEFTFKTVIHYKNLKPEELGVLLIALGQDLQHPIALKLGGGKPIGMGTVTVSVAAIDHAKDIHNRYQQYDSQDNQLTGAALKTFMQQHIQVAHASKLLEKPQLKELVKILGYPSNREPPAGMY